VVRARATALLHEDPFDTRSRICGVLLDDGRVVRAREVVIANGMGAAGLGGLPEGLVLPLRPVHGDILRLRVPEHLQPLCTATLRGMVRGLPVYVVPRNDGTVVIGASSREDGSAGVNAGSVHQLLRDAQVLLPAVAELELIETTARARPGTPDNAPLLGRVAASDGTEMPGLVIATGFFRHGVLLAPIAARITTQLLAGVRDPAWDRFRPDRFSPALQPQEIP
jgi:glycine oxidase